MIVEEPLASLVIRMYEQRIAKVFGFANSITSLLAQSLQQNQRLRQQNTCPFVR